MTGTWIKRSLQYYSVQHAAFAGTVALTSAILSAALLTGESLQAGLRRGLRERLGATRSAVHLAEGAFPVSLAGRLPNAQAALLLRSQVLDANGAVCADQAQLIGVPEEARSVTCLPPAEAERVLRECGEPNPRAKGLLASGECAVRFEKPPLFSVEMPLGAAKESRLVRRAVRLLGLRAFRPESLLPPDFALQAASVPPVNVFQPLGPLAEAAGVPGLANLLVSSAEPAALERALAEKLALEDAGLVLEDGGPEPKGGAPADTSRELLVARPSTLIKARRVFLPPGLGGALASKGFAAEWATFHLADAFEAGTNTTPYGFVAAVTPGLAGAPADLKDGEVVISAWLADALGLTTNDTLTLRWRRFEAGGRLVADSRAFRVRGVLPTEAAALAKRLMPVFPGLEGVDSCSAWDVGLPMDEEKLKDPANEAYWKQWRETPKAFMTYTAGKACFGSAFGEAMSVRVAAGEQEVRRAMKALTPAQLGFRVRPLWEEGLVVAEGATDFKGLFVGLAFVLVASALLLAALSLSLALERRKGEVALFRALGWRRGRIAAALAAEWSVPLAAGAAAGASLGAGLARALVWGLGRFWRGAFAGAEIGFTFSWPVAGLAASASAALALAVLLSAVRRLSRCPPAELWQSAGREPAPFSSASAGVCSRLPVSWETLLGCALAVAAGVLMLRCPAGTAANGAFFGAGFLLLLSLLLFVRTAGAAWACRRPESFVASPIAAGVGRALLAPRRSAPVVVTLAVGVFLTTGILSMKHDPADGCERPSSGSGGFASLVTSVAPLERERGLALARRVSGSKGAVPVRVLDGDEAGCLNMNRPARPRVLGLDASAMARSRAFEPEDAGGVWSVLGAELPDGTLPALAADQTMLQYSLKAKAGLLDGTTYEYPGAGGRAVRVRVVGALPVRSGILQGALLVDEPRFAEAFPGAGYRLWLCDYAPYLLREAADGGGQGTEDGDRTADLRSPVSALRHPEPGVTVETVEERLRLLGSVESAYLDMFLVLGGLGVVLGVFGVALVILRGVEERRGELATLSALGLPRAAVVRLLAAEYGALAAAGLACGVLPALAAIQPAARSLGGRLPWGAMAGVVAGLALAACASVLAAALAASRRFGPEVLKDEV